MPSDLDRGIMKFRGADSTSAIAVSSVVILGAIAALIWLSLQAAYCFV